MSWVFTQNNEGNGMKIEKAFKIGKDVVKFESEFLGFKIYRLDKRDDDIIFYFVDSKDIVVGISHVTSTANFGDGHFSSCDAEFKLVK